MNVNNGIKYQHLLIDKINDKAQLYYKPVAYDGNILLFKPKIYYAGFKDPEYGWSKLALKGVEVIEMPVYPRGLLNEPFVSTLAQKLKRKIDEGG